MDREVGADEQERSEDAGGPNGLEEQEKEEKKS